MEDEIPEGDIEDEESADINQYCQDISKEETEQPYLLIDVTLAPNV